MTKVFLRFCVFLLAFLLHGPAASAQSIELKRGIPTDIWITWPQGEQLEAPEIVEQFPEYRKVFKGGEFKLARDAGFDFVRLTVDPAIFLWNPSRARTETLVAGVKQAITEIRSEDLKVVVDLHSIPHPDPTMGTDQVLKSDASFSQYLQVVDIIGRAISDFPEDSVAFEPMNEPNIDCAWNLKKGAKPRWPAMAQKLHKTARQAAPKLTLIISGACWGGAEGLAALEPARFKDRNIIWSFHSYAPFLFTHQGASWTKGKEQFVEGLTFPPQKNTRKPVLKNVMAKVDAAKLPKSEKARMKAELATELGLYFQPGQAEKAAKAPFKQVEAWAAANRIPAKRIMLGEFGAIRSDLSRPLPEAERARFLELVRKEAEARGWAWSVWSWGGSFGLNKTGDSWEFSPVLLKSLGLHGSDTQ